MNEEEWPFLLKKSMSEEKLFENPDPESLAKTRFAAYYFGLFMRIIDSTRKRYCPNKSIVYADFFAGPGKYKSNQHSVPLKVLESAKGLENIRFFFNDLKYPQELERNILSHLGVTSLPCNIEVHGQDARTIDLGTVFTADDIVVSYVDSMSYFMCDVETISKLIENPFSDCLMFLNTEHFYRYRNSATERQNFVRYFGSTENYESFCAYLSEEEDKDKITKWLLQDFIGRLNTKAKKPLFYLPIFFRKSNSSSPISHILLAISKSDKGIKTIRDSFTEVSEERDERGQRAENFRFENNRIFVYENPGRNQLSLFDDNAEKYKPIIRFLPKSSSDAVSCSDLLKKIDEHYLKERRYLSGYSERYLRQALSYFEDNGIIGIVYKSSKKRRKNTFGEKTLVYLKEGIKA